MCSEKYVWLLNSLFTAFYVIDKSYRHELTPHQQFAAPFKAGNSRQVQTYYIPQNTTQRNCNIISGSYQLRRNGSSHDLEPQSVDVKKLPT